MTKITKSSLCGNSPKNALVQNLFIWKATKNAEALIPFLDENAEWIAETGKAFVGVESIVKVLVGEGAPKSLKVDHAFAHGKVGVAQGHVTLSDGKAEIWCDFFEFAGASAKKIEKIESFKKKIVLN